MNIEKSLTDDLNKFIDENNPDVWESINKAVSNTQFNKKEYKAHTSIFPTRLLRPAVTFMMLLLSITLILNNEIMLFKACVLAADYPEGSELVIVDEDFKEAVNNFGLNSASLLLSDNDTNANYSPISLYFALSMAAVGTNGKTHDEFFNVLGVPDKDIAYLSDQVEKLYRSIYFDNKYGKLQIANSLWLSDTEEFKKSFIYNIKQKFYASLYSVDFNNTSTKYLISEWVSNNTGSTLKPNMDISPNTVLELINTVYFHEQWKDKFDDRNTKPDTFTLKNGDNITCDFLNGVIDSYYSQGESYKKASLSFKNGGKMMFILPNIGVDINDLIKDPETLESILNESQMGSYQVTYKIPKFSFKSSFNLKDTLVKLGLETAFIDADFSVMVNSDSNNNLFISKTQQETSISISEEGVKASAYTRQSIEWGSGPEEKAELILDRPFIYGITAKDGTLLFVGVCMNPSKK